MILSHSPCGVFTLKADIFLEIATQKGDSKPNRNMWEHPHLMLWLLYWNHLCSLVSSWIITLNHHPIFQNSWSNKLSHWPHRHHLLVHSVLLILVPATCALKDDMVQGVFFLSPALWTTIPKPHRHGLFLSRPHLKLSTLLHMMMVAQPCPFGLYVYLQLLDSSQNWIESLFYFALL